MYLITRVGILFFILLAASAVFADDVEDAYAICLKHQIPEPARDPGKSIWEQNWQHCKPIADVKEGRDRTRDVLDEKKNAELKKTRDVSRALGGK